MNRTPLFETHLALQSRIVPFAGWEMPVFYPTGIINEHLATRNHAGLFDVSHMGEFFVEGPDAEKFLQYVTCNDLNKISDGQAQYNALLNEKGGVIDDIIIYRQSPQKFLVCVNAGNIENDFKWLQEHASKFEISLLNRSDEFGLIALQGPKAAAILHEVFPESELEKLPRFGHTTFSSNGKEYICARTGYTGEDGFEIFCPKDEAVNLWNALLSAGKEEGLVPAGLGARDTLRLEAGYPLHGHELDSETSALQSGLAWIVKFQKGDFIGKIPLEVEKIGGVQKSLVGFSVEGAGIVRDGTKLFTAEKKEIGVVTSGTKTPCLEKPIGMARIDSNLTAIGAEIFAEVRGNLIACKVVKLPFVKK